ncbi:hypothetical protein C7I55_03550 [Sphingomonas deserti]|uniref:Uncharacterized protein n=1 Tax=Allosphingosinicella deserti TaxID=2116704 RepID=A0A2P7QZQ1_9SPHN|nr:hypothetical protein C7I55_03550 [Sphingomonas deserti]
MAAHEGWYRRIFETSVRGVIARRGSERQLAPDRRTIALRRRGAGSYSRLRPVADIPDRCKTAWMPVAQPPLPAENPAPIGPEDARFIKETVARFYGPDAVVRSYGPEPRRLKLHVEIRGEPGMERYDCAGVLYARLDREQIALEVTKHGTAPRGEAKIAYRQGVIL